MFISDSLQHADVDIIHQVQHGPISKEGIPQHQNILHGKFTAKQQPNPATAKIDRKEAN